MKSIYEQAMGTAFQSLHPKLQEKFSLTSDQHVMARSVGVMDQVWGGAFYMKPALQILAKKHLTFKERGENIPFVLENVAYRNQSGIECFAWLRSFQFTNVERRFDATMIYDAKTRRIVDYLGIDQDVISTISANVSEGGGLKLTSNPLMIPFHQRLVRVPKWLNGTAEVMEWYDDANDVFRIHVEVTNPYFGTIFGYEGSFVTDYYPIDHIPESAIPRNERIKA
ncbi:DUF4166 domain-containing protein [Alkalihalobacillus sp. LMS6]|uniref:DUF4166 domain-containing protein n=1 Tax=Alkalihalobacillus sp. LMS6 TaxID=2924034 RepID=UPI0020D11300|nr:DUF4166 domain-containing protein [Alkalihalobacillus sp. LMS6]UTR06129.1 DUF4166 domain-containing protein [Alkalihalobacillus sp. LMS6]